MAEKIISFAAGIVLLLALTIFIVLPALDGWKAERFCVESIRTLEKCKERTGSYSHRQRDKLIEEKLRNIIIPEMGWYCMQTRHALWLVKETVQSIDLGDGDKIEVTIPDLEGTPYWTQTIKCYARDISLFDAMTMIARLTNIGFEITNRAVIFTYSEVQPWHEGY